MDGSPQTPPPLCILLVYSSTLCSFWQKLIKEWGALLNALSLKWRRIHCVVVLIGVDSTRLWRVSFSPLHVSCMITLFRANRCRVVDPVLDINVICAGVSPRQHVRRRTDGFSSLSTTEAHSPLWLRRRFVEWGNMFVVGYSHSPWERTSDVTRVALQAAWLALSKFFVDSVDGKAISPFPCTRFVLFPLFY